jgi:chromate transporter
VGKKLCLFVPIFISHSLTPYPAPNPSQPPQVYPLLLILGSLFTLVDSKRSNPIGTYKGASSGWDADNDLTFRRIGIPLWVGFAIFVFWALLLAACLIYRSNNDSFNTGGYLPLFECMYRVGSIIFGGGQVVLPMLYGEVVDTGWISKVSDYVKGQNFYLFICLKLTAPPLPHPPPFPKDTFYQGFALAQSLPGPLFNFSSFVGGAYLGVGGALVAYVGLFGPGVILIFAMMPFWATLRQTAWFKAVLVGLNSTAIGFIFAACILMWQSAVTNAASAAAFCVAGSMALVYKVRELRGEANEAEECLDVVSWFDLVTLQAQFRRFALLSLGVCFNFFISGPRFFSSLSHEIFP